MDYSQFLEQVIEGGIRGVKKDYTRPEQKQKLDGSIAGFEACRGKQPKELADLLSDAEDITRIAHREQSKMYWYRRCYESEIEWVCNCVSAVLVNEGLEPIITPTACRVMRAAEIIGIGEKRVTFPPISLN